MNKPISPHFKLARRRAQRHAALFGDTYLNHPAILRQGNPLPADLDSQDDRDFDAEARRRDVFYDHLILVCCALAFACLFFVGP